MIRTWADSMSSRHSSTPESSILCSRPSLRAFQNFIGAPMSEAQQPTFGIEKIYVKDLSLEVLFEVTLVSTVSAKRGDKTMFLVEASQAGVFQIRNVPDAELAPVLGIVCPNVLFPYARETVSDVINRAGFPPVLLASVNFEALYQQRAAETTAQPGGPRIEVAH